MDPCETKLFGTNLVCLLIGKMKCLFLVEAGSSSISSLDFCVESKCLATSVIAKANRLCRSNLTATTAMAIVVIFLRSVVENINLFVKTDQLAFTRTETMLGQM